MTRREFEDSIVGELKVLWLDPDEVRGIIRKTFAFADNKYMFDFLEVGKMREIQKAIQQKDTNIDWDELRRLEKEVDKIVERKIRKRYERKIR